jgi:hypothetical protein
VWRIVLGFAEEFEDLVAIDGGELPFLVVGGLPGVRAFGEVFLRDEGHGFLGVQADGESKEDEDRSHGTKVERAHWGCKNQDAGFRMLEVVV